MTYDNVQLWFARDTNNKIVTINEVDKKNKEGYTCPLCNSEVIPRQGEKNSWCFAHIDKSKCNSESMYHWWYKNKFLIQGDKFIVKADEDKEYIVKSIETEKEYKVGDKTYRPDVTVLTTTGETIFFEMDYSNKKKIEDYIDIWIELNSIVVEIDLKTLMNSSLDNKREFKALYYMGKCFNIKSKDKGYHDIIGKYKEQLIQDKEYDKNKDQVEKLDWFWKDIQNYKMNKEGVDEIVLLIDTIDNFNIKEIIYKVLMKNKCNDIKDAYENFKINIYKNKIIENLKCNYDEYGINLVIGKAGINKKIRLSYTKSNNLETECFVEYLWKNNWFNNKEQNKKDKQLVSKYIKIQIKRREQIELYKENWFKIKNIIKILLQENYNENFILSIIENENFIEIYAQNKYLLKEKICTITYEEIKSTILEDIKFDLISDDAEEKILDRFNFILLQLNKNIELWRYQINIYRDTRDFLINRLNEESYIKNIEKDNSNNKIIKFVDINNNQIKFYFDINLNYYNEINEHVDDNYIKINVDDMYDILSNKCKLILYNNEYNVIKTYSYYNYGYNHKNYTYKSELFKDMELKFTFKRNKEYHNLPRYNFINANKELLKLIKNYIEPKLNEKEFAFQENSEKGFFINKDVDSYIYSEEIDNKIKKILYPIYYLKATTQNKELKIMFNICFTKNKEEEYEPWIINDFIDNLLKIGINAKNVITSN